MGFYSLFYFWGVGNFNGNVLVDVVVVFNYDGVYVGCFLLMIGFFYDLEWVEVFKGL